MSEGLRRDPQAVRRDQRALPLPLITTALQTVRLHRCCRRFVRITVDVVAQQFIDRAMPRTWSIETARQRGGGSAPTSRGLPQGLAASAASFISSGPVRVATLASLSESVAHHHLHARHRRRIGAAPADVFVTLPLGAIVGTVVLLAFGQLDRRSDARGDRVRARRLRTAPSRGPSGQGRRHGWPYHFATLDDGTRLFVKVPRPQERAADLMFHVYRFLV